MAAALLTTALATASGCAEGVLPEEPPVASAGTGNGAGGDATGGSGEGGSDASGGTGNGGEDNSNGGSAQAGSTSQSTTSAFVKLQSDVTIVDHSAMMAGMDFSDSCPTNQVLVGFEGTVDAAGGESYLRSVSGACATMTISDVDPTRVQITTDSSLSARGTEAEVVESATCPKNQVVVGFAGSADMYIEAIELICAPLMIEDLESNPKLSIGATSNSAQFGGSSGSAFADVECPAGTVAASQEVVIQDGVTGFGLGCVVVQIEGE